LSPYLKSDSMYIIPHIQIFSDNSKIGERCLHFGEKGGLYGRL